MVEPGGRCSWCGKEEYLMIVEALTAVLLVQTVTLLDVKTNALPCNRSWR